MIVREAVIETSAEDATRTVAGLPRVLRTVLVLQRAGIERVRIAGPAAVPADPRVRIDVGRGAGDVCAPQIVIGQGAVVDLTLVRAALDAAPVRCERDGAWIEVRDGGRPPHAEPSLAGTLIATSAPRSRIVRALLRALENSHDGYLDRLIHRRLSRPTTALLLHTALTPNQVTVVGVIIGLVGGWLVGSPSSAGVLAGIAALVASGVLDCSDGELARIRFTESRLGHLLDVTGDTVVHAALLAGIARELARVGAWPGTPTLVLLGVGVVGGFVTITWSERTEARRHRVPGAWENRLLDGILSPLTTRDWYVFPVAFAVPGRLDLLVSSAAWGAQVFWVTVAVLVRRVLRRVPDERARVA